MAVDVVTEIVINRPTTVVASYVADPSNAPEWYVNIKSVEWKMPPPLGVGSRLAFVAQFLGRRLAYTSEIVELVKDERHRESHAGVQLVPPRGVFDQKWLALAPMI